MRRNSMFSGGEGSFRATMIDRRRHPDAEYRLVFTDTLYEDADTYRFMIEAAAIALGRNLNWSVKAEDFPDYRVPMDTPIEEYHGNPDWRACLADLRARATDAMPELVWLVEGRDPWEVFRDRLFLGNDHVDLCSRILKRELADDWRIANCHRVGELFGPPDVCVVGIGAHEVHRFDDGEGGGIGPRNLADGWIYEAPLLSEATFLPGEGDFFFAPIETFGPARQRMYELDYAHANCGGGCCRAGQAHWSNRFRVQRDRYDYDAWLERSMRNYLGKDVSFLTDRRGGDKKMMSLDAFAERLEADPTLKIDYAPGESGCGCMMEIA